MTPPHPHETAPDWPRLEERVLDRDPVLAALEEAWRAGLLIEREPAAA
ncbi:MAG TPA: hypothetical protein VI408_10395 [Gaiellaceae bacterium]